MEGCYSFNQPTGIDVESTADRLGMHRFVCDVAVLSELPRGLLQIIRTRLLPREYVPETDRRSVQI